MKDKDSMDYQHSLDFHRQLVKTATDHGLKCMNALFLLNGAAGTALLAKPNTPLLSITFFAAGAICAVLSLAMGYVTNGKFAEYWSPYSQKDERILKLACRMTYFTAAIAIASFLLFLLGAIATARFLMGALACSF